MKVVGRGTASRPRRRPRPRNRVPEAGKHEDEEESEDDDEKECPSCVHVKFRGTRLQPHRFGPTCHLSLVTRHLSLTGSLLLFILFFLG